MCIVSYTQPTDMKTENEKFYANSLAVRAKELLDLAVEAGEKTRRADDAVATCEGDDAQDANTLQSLFDKRNALAELQDEAERLAFNAERAAYYASRGDNEQVAWFTSFDPSDC